MDMVHALEARVRPLFPIRTERGSVELAEPATREPVAGVYRVGSFVVSSGWGLSVELRTTRAQGTSTEGGYYLCATNQLDDPRLGPYTEGFILALRSVLERATDTSMRDWAIGNFDHLPLEVLDANAPATHYRDYFLTYPWLGRLLPTRPPKAPAYVHAPAAAVSPARGESELDRLWSWIWQHARSTYVDLKWDDAMTKALPEPVRVLSALLTIHSMVGGNGFEVFLAQARGTVVRDAYQALVTVGAEQLRALMAKGIPLAEREGATFTSERARKWLDAFNDPASSWSEIDGHEPDRSYALLNSELVPAAERYANAHRAALVRD